MKLLTPILCLLLTALNATAQQIPRFIKKATDINPVIRMEPLKSVSMNGKLYFAGSNRLYVTDGTSSGTKLIKEFAHGSLPIHLTVLNNKLLFAAKDSTMGNELWTSDGTAQGTQVLIDINPGIANAISTANDERPYAILPVLQNHAFFYANDGTHGIELWKTDGTATGTIIVKDINTEPGKGIRDTFSSMDMIAHNNRLYFLVDKENGDADVWSTDGTANDMVNISNLVPGHKPHFANHFFSLKNQLLFSGAEMINPPYDFTSHIYAYDGNSVNMITDSAWSAYIHEWKVIGNKVFFIAENDAKENLYFTDGTKQGTTILKEDLQSGGVVGPTKFIQMEEANGLLTFITRGGSASEYELWVSDGTPGGTKKIKNSSYEINSNTTFGNSSYFKVWDRDMKSVQLWKTDGTEQGTTQIIYPGADFSALSGLVLNALMRSTLLVSGTRMFFFNGYSSSDSISLYQLDMWPAGIEHTGKQQEITVYPNPANSKVYIKGDDIGSINLSNIDGTTLYKKDVDGNGVAIDISQYPAGLYFINATTSEGKVFAKSFVKQ